MPKFVLLWTDAAIWLLVAALVAYAVMVARRPQWAANWRKVFHDAPALCSSLILLLCLGVTLLDSVHYRPLLPPAPGAPERRAGLRHAHEVGAGRGAAGPGALARGDLFAAAVLPGLHQGIGDGGRRGPARGAAPGLRRRAPAGPGDRVGRRSRPPRRRGPGRGGRGGAAAVRRLGGADRALAPAAAGRYLARHPPPRRRRALARCTGHADRAVSAGRAGHGAVGPLPPAGHRPHRQRRALPVAEEHPHRLRHRHAGHRGDAAAGGGAGPAGGLFQGLGRRGHPVPLHRAVVGAQRAAHRRLRADGAGLPRQEPRPLRDRRRARRPQALPAVRRARPHRLGRAVPAAARRDAQAARTRIRAGRQRLRRRPRPHHAAPHLPQRRAPDAHRHRARVLLR